MKKRGISIFLVLFLVFLSVPMADSHWMEEYREVVDEYGNLITGKAVADEDYVYFPGLNILMPEDVQEPYVEPITPVTVQPISTVSYEPYEQVIQEKEPIVIVAREEDIPIVNIQEPEETVIVSQEGECVLTKAYWNKKNSKLNELVELIVESSGDCNGKDFTATIYEQDTIFDEEVIKLNGKFRNNVGKLFWNVNFKDSGMFENDQLEFYFKSSLGTLDKKKEVTILAIFDGGTIKSDLLIVDLPKATGVTEELGAAVTADIEVFNQQGLAPYTVLFNGFGSISANGEVVKYEWDFGDENLQYPRKDTGRMVGHRFDKSGMYDVYLTVTDETGAEATASMQIQVLNRLGTARTYYVSSQGDDNNDGLSPATAWGTISKVSSEASSIPDGSQILFRRGDTFTSTGSWNIGALMRQAPYYIKIGAYGTDNRPVIQSSGGNDGTIYTGHVVENRGVILEDLHITNTGSASGGVRVIPSYYSSSQPIGFRYPGHQLIMRNSLIDSDGQVMIWGSQANTYENSQIICDSSDDTGAVVGFGTVSGGTNTGNLYVNNLEVEGCRSHCVYLAEDAENVLFENSELHHCGIYRSTGGAIRDGFTAHGTIDNVIIRNNDIHNNGYAIGLDDGYDTLESIRDAIVEDNRIHDQRYYGFQFSSIQNLIFRNNLIYNNALTDPRSNLIVIQTPSNGGGVRDEDSDNVQIYNNVIYNNKGEIFHFEGSQVHKIYVKNNIVVANGERVLSDADADDLEMSNNLYYGNIPNIAFIINGQNLGISNWLSSGKDPNSLNADPLFLDLGNLDFHLQAISPAIDKGVTLAKVYEDFDGNLRPQGSGYDIGAYEYLTGGIQFDFDISVNPISGTVVQGESLKELGVVNVNRVSGEGNVSFSAISLPRLPAGSIIKFTPSKCELSSTATSCDAKMEVYVPIGMTPRNYKITIGGLAGALVKNASFDLTVQQSQNLFNNIAKGCTNAFYIDEDCDGYGVASPLGPDTDDSDKDVNTGDTFRAKYGDDVKVRDFITNKYRDVVKEFYGSDYKPGDIYYVDKEKGNDAWNGLCSVKEATSNCGPRKSFNDALRGALQPGDVLIYRGGNARATTVNDTYVYPGFNSRKPYSYNEFISGTKEKPILFMTYPGEFVTIHKPSYPSMGYRNSNYVIFDGFIVEWLETAPNHGHLGFELGSGHHVVIMNIESVNFDWGMWGSASPAKKDVLIDHNVLHDNPDEHGLYIPSYVEHQRITIRDSLFYRNGRNGIQLNGPMSDFLVENNIIHTNEVGGIQIKNGVKNSVFRNNLIFNNNHNALTLHTYNETQAPPNALQSLDYNIFENNIFWVGAKRNGLGSGTGNPAGFSAVKFVDGLDKHTFTGNKFRNNILITAGGRASFYIVEKRHVSETIIENNVFYVTGKTLNGDGPVLRSAETDGTESGKYQIRSEWVYWWNLNKVQSLTHLWSSVFKNNIMEEPKFVDVSVNYNLNPEKFDFYHKSDSKAIDFGIKTTTTPLYDIRGYSRTAIPDAGCYEYISQIIKGDKDKDGVPDTIDCNDNNPQVGQCRGCARCSDPQGISGTCVSNDNACKVIECQPPMCGFGNCSATQYALFNKTQQQTCMVVRDIGVCGPKLCSPISCVNNLGCATDGDGDGIFDFMDKCPKTPPQLHPFVNKYNGCPRPRWNMSRFHPNLTTNFSEVYDLFNVSLKLGAYGKGQIWFVNQKVPLLIRNMSTAVTSKYHMHYYPINLDRIDIEYNKITIDTKNETSNYSVFNKPATLKLFNLSFSNPRILKDGNVCSECSVSSYVNGDLEFEVPGFSTYTAGETPSSQGGSSGTTGGGGGGGGGGGARTVRINLDEEKSFLVSTLRFGKIFITYNNNLYSIRITTSRIVKNGIRLITSPNQESFDIALSDAIGINLDPFPDLDMLLTFKGDRGGRIELLIERIDKKIPSIRYPDFTKKKDKIELEAKDGEIEERVKDEVKKGLGGLIVKSFIVAFIVAIALTFYFMQRFRRGFFRNK